MFCFKKCVLTVVLGSLSAITFAQQKEELVIGMMSGWAPFMVVNAKGNLEGFDVDVAKELGMRLGKPVRILDLGSLASLFQALEQGKIAMAFSGLDITQKRKEQWTMIPYAGEQMRSYSLLFWKTLPKDVKTLEDLQRIPNAEVCVESGVSTEKFLERFPSIRKKRMGALADMVLDVQFGKSLALFIEPPIARRLIKKNGEFKALEVPLPEEFQVYGMGIALKKSNQELSQKVGTFIQKMKAEGSLQKLEKKWSLSGDNT